MTSIFRPTWRAFAYFFTGLPVAFAVSMFYGIAALPWVAMVEKAYQHDATGSQTRVNLGNLPYLAVFMGLVTIAVAPVASMLLGAIERRRLRLIDGRPVAAGISWDARLWRPLAYGVVLAVLGPVAYGVLAFTLVLALAFVSAPFLVAQGEPISLGIGQLTATQQPWPYAVAGIVLLGLLPFAAAGAARGHAAVARALLRIEPGSQAVVEVSQSRARLADAFDAERRRIERDLHDGAQQRLISLTLQLGLARLDLPADSPAAQAVTQAHEQAKQLMIELRELIHGIRPQTLAEAGLAAALRELADQSTIAVSVDAELPQRPAEALATTAYFAVAEALNNIAKHSGASSALVLVRKENQIMSVEIRDDGRGDANPSGGTGLTGIADRVAAVNGRMLLSSPAGGPTVVRVELPWRAA